MVGSIVNLICYLLICFLNIDKVLYLLFIQILHMVFLPKKCTFFKMFISGHHRYVPVNTKINLFFFHDFYYVPT